MNGEQYEIRKNDDGTLDEVVAHQPEYVHLEQMNYDGWLLIIGLKDGSEIRVSLYGKLRPPGTWPGATLRDRIVGMIPTACVDAFAEVE